jgi:hypothetical protein
MNGPGHSLPNSRSQLGGLDPVRRLLVLFAIEVGKQAGTHPRVTVQCREALALGHGGATRGR